MLRIHKGNIISMRTLIYLCYQMSNWSFVCFLHGFVLNVIISSSLSLTRCMGGGLTEIHMQVWFCLYCLNTYLPPDYWSQLLKIICLQSEISLNVLYIIHSTHCIITLKVDSAQLHVFVYNLLFFFSTIVKKKTEPWCKLYDVTCKGNMDLNACHAGYKDLRWI